MYPPSRPLTVGELLDLAFRIFRATVLKCLPLAVGALLLRQLPNIYLIATHKPLALGTGNMSDPIWLLALVVGYVLGTTVLAAIVLRQDAIARGQPLAAGEALALGLRRAPAIIGTGILIGILVAACFLPALFFMSNGPALVVALLVLLVPASYVVIRILCAYPLCILRRYGPVESIERSWDLTAGSFWRLTAVYTLAMIVLFVFYMLAGLVAGAIAAPLGFGDVAFVTAITTSLVVILGAFGTPFYTAIALAVLSELTARREGADLAARISGPATS